MLARLELDPAFSADLEHYAVHPALLDAATALSAYLVPELRAYLPASYRRVAIHRRLPRAIWSHVRRRAGGPDDLVCDVCLTDAAGQILVEIEGYRAVKGPLVRSPPDAGALSPERGMDAIERIVSHTGFRQVVVLPRDASDELKQQRPLTLSLDGRAGAGEIDANAEGADAGSVNERVTRIWNEVLGTSSVDLDASFFTLGGHSLMALQLQAKLYRATGVHISIRQLFAVPTLRALIAFFDATLDASAASLARAAPSPPAGSGRSEPARAERSGLTPLTTCQSWFFSSGHFDDLRRWNSGGVVTLRRRLDPECLRGAVHAVVARHDALRARFARGPSGWVQEILPPEALAHEQPFRCIERPGLGAAEQESLIASVGAELQSEFELERGLLFRVALFDFGSGAPERLLVLAHHVIVDATSHNILFEDFEQSYWALLSARRSPQPEPTPFRAWALAFDAHAKRHCASEAAQWLELARSDYAALPLDRPEARAQNIEASTAVVSCHWDADILRRVVRPPHAAAAWRAPDALLFSFVQTLFDWTLAPELLIKVMNSGRFLLPAAGELDVTRAVGPFAFAGLCRFRKFRSSSLAGASSEFRAQLDAIRDGGTGAEIIAQSHPDRPTAEAVRRLLGKNQVLFNYYLRTDLESSALAESVRVFRTATRSPSDRRPDVLECTFVESEAGLFAEFGYSERLHERGTIERLAARLRERVEAWSSSRE